MQKQRSPKYPDEDFNSQHLKEKRLSHTVMTQIPLSCERVLSLVYQKICQLFVNLKFIQHYSMPENSAYLPLHI